MDTFLLALSFLTRLPVRVPEPKTDDELATASLWFPWIGLLIGAFLSGIFIVSDKIGLVPVSPLITLLALILITGALHWDGLADTADGLLAPGDKIRRLAIMKDPHLGTMGVLAIVVVFLMQFSALRELSPGQATLILLVAPMLSRTAMLLLATFSLYAREDGTGAAFVGNISKTGALTSSLITIAFLFGLIGNAVIGLVCVAGATTFLLRTYAYKTIGGITGDILGASCVLVEAALFVAALVFLA